MKSILSLVLAAVFGLGVSSAVADPTRPNVVVMMADDLGYGDLSCYGSRKIKTPVLDDLARGGIRLTSFYAGATVCTPSRMALLTGCYPTRLGWRGGVLGYKMKTDTGLSPRARTMAEVFKEAGYRSALCGKWHLGSSAELLPGAQGFDRRFFIKLSNNQTQQLWRDVELVADPFDNRRLTEQFTREAIDFIRSESDAPFFLYLPFTAPHFPAQAHPDWKGRSENGAYGDVVEELDARVGEILAALREKGVEDNTIVVFLSDNGPEPGQKNFATALPYRGLKWSSLEGGTRVPCIVSWPGVVPPGQVSAELMSAIDLLPTLAQAAGIALGEGEGSLAIDGLDVWKTLVGKGEEGEAVSHARGDLLYWDGWATPQAIRVGDWKLYFDAVDGVSGSTAGPALFDLASDPGEAKNVGSEQPDRMAAMLALARKRLGDIQVGSIKLGGAGVESEQVVPRKPRWLE